MNNRQTAIDKQIEHWILVGPLLMLGALLVLFLIPIRPVLLTSIALIGLPLCWKWQLPAASTADVKLCAAANVSRETPARRANVAQSFHVKPAVGPASTY